MSIGLEAPPYFILRSSASKPGPATIRPGEEYEFLLHFDVDPAAPLGCARAWVTESSSEIGLVPDPLDNPHPLDYVVLPATGTPGRAWQRFVSALGCRKRLASAEKPDRRVLCRRRLRALASEDGVETLWFGSSDRTRADAAFADVVHEARAGSVPAVLELGYREGEASRKALRALQGDEPIESAIASLQYIYDCEEKAPEMGARIRSMRRASRLALARLGELGELKGLQDELASSDSRRVDAAVAALAYVGGARASSLLAGRLRASSPQDPARYTVIQALESLEPAQAEKIRSASASIEEQATAWDEWARRR